MCLLAGLFIELLNTLPYPKHTSTPGKTVPIHSHGKDVLHCTLIPPVLNRDADLISAEHDLLLVSQGLVALSEC